MSNPVDFIQRALTERAERRSITKALHETNRHLERIADALEVFSKPAEMELLDKVEKSVRKRDGGKLTIGEFDVGAAEKHYKEATEGKVPPPPDNTEATGPI